LTFLTPLAALVALGGVVAVALVVVGRHRAERVRETLALEPGGERALVRPALVAAVTLLVAFAAAQPALTHHSPTQIRAGTQAMFVLDTSRSMAASSGPGQATRLDRARAIAVSLRREIPHVAAGVATLTDRVLPDLFPVPDARGFDGVVDRAVAVESPPPRAAAIRATDYGALAALSHSGFFAPATTRRIVVLLTDGESVPVPLTDLARAFGGTTKLVVVQTWRGDEGVFDESGRRELNYTPDPGALASLQAFVDAVGGTLARESDLAPARRALAALGGHGAVRRLAGVQTGRTPLAPYLLAAALVPALALLSMTGARVRSRKR
jgi:hypothetical protein